MKSKFIFWILAVIVFGAILYLGTLFLHTNLYMFLVIEGIGVLSVILFFFLYYRLIRPYHIILEGMELLKAQDFSTRLRPTSSKEANDLIEVFNKMMEQLKDERLRVREKNQFLDLLIGASPQGVIILDFDDKITGINPSGLRLLGIDDLEDVLGKKLIESDIKMAGQLASLEPQDDVVIRSSGITMYRCVRSSFLDRGFAHPFILVEELTHELLKTEKKSYEGIIRMMAHEVNNSVGAIGATLNVISDILSQDEYQQISEFRDVVPAVDASYDRCRHLGKFISNFAEVVKIPEPVLSSVDVNELARSVDALTSIECQRRNIKLILKLAEGKSIVTIDSIQFEQVLVNIVKNAYEAIGENGEIRIVTRSVPSSITIMNNGSEITEEVRHKLFTPFFTTKQGGQGVGLMFVREVLLNHGCKFDLRSEGGWTSFDISFK